MPVYLLPEEPIFPPASEARDDGLIAIGGDFSTGRLLNAYASGIFPWFVHDGEPYWFSPDPRMVLFPDQLKVSRSLKRSLRSGRFDVQIDRDFESVIRYCSQVRRSHETDTWISEEFIEGYSKLHRAGFAHCVTCYAQGELVGGLYGVSLGRAFFGESMFHLQPNASKVALFYLAEQLKAWEFHFIDCQVETDHFRWLGAKLIPRTDFLARLAKAIKFPTKKGSWMSDARF